MKRIVLPALVSILLATAFTACNRAENYSNLEYEVLKQWNLRLASANVVPTTNRQDTGSIILQVASDGRVQYQYQVDMMSGDSIIGLTINSGDMFSSGPVVLDLKPKGSVGFGTGTAFNVRQTLLDSMQNPSNDYYISMISVRQPNGMVRAQLNNDLVFSANVLLLGANEVPPVTTTAIGQSSFRINSSRILYSRIVVNNLEATDALTMAHIHTGAPGVNGPVYVALASSAADFNVTKTTQLTAAQFDDLVNSQNRFYVNAHTVLYPAGKVRGQLK